MSKTLIKSSLIIPMDEERPDFFYGDIMIEGNEIKKITPSAELTEYSGDEDVIDASQLIVMPGLINTHGHAAMTLFRGYADDMPLKQWLEQKIWPIEALLEAEDVYWGTLLSITEMIRGGTTTFTDMYYFMDKVAGAAAESGIRAVLSRGLIGLRNGDPEGFKETRTFVRDWHGAENGRISVMLGPHAPNTGPHDFLHRVNDLAAETGLPIQIHLAETEHEVEECCRSQGLTPVSYLNSMGLFDHRVIAAHCVYVDDADMEIMAEKNVGVAHNPGSNLKLGSGIAPVARMLQKGIKVGLGTDGASSNNNLDMVEEMRLAALLAKGISHDPTLLDAHTALKMATAYGAEALNLERLGMIREGCRADLIGLRRRRPHLTPLHDPLAHLVYSAAAADVDLVMVDGRLLMVGGELRTLDEEKIMAEASRCAQRLVEGSKKK